MSKETLKMRVARLYYTIKGYFLTRKMVVGEYYSSEHVQNSRYMYRGDRTFYRAYAASPVPGVVFESQEKLVLDYWKIGILNLK